MIGISKDIANRFSESELLRLFGPSAHKGEIRVRYARPNGDLTAPLPSSRHMQYAAKGWTAVSIDEPEAPTPQAEIVVPADILEHANHDRVGIWTRGADSHESSCRNAQSLIAKGWTFAGLADETRRRLVAEARPVPASPTASRIASSKDKGDAARPS